eukprot:4563493-Amphidinium_carterae.1
MPQKDGQQKPRGRSHSRRGQKGQRGLYLHCAECSSVGVVSWIWADKAAKGGEHAVCRECGAHWSTPRKHTDHKQSDSNTEGSAASKVATLLAAKKFEEVRKLLAEEEQAAAEKQRSTKDDPDHHVQELKKATDKRASKKKVYDQTLERCVELEEKLAKAKERLAKEKGELEEAEKDVQKWKAK